MIVIIIINQHIQEERMSVLHCMFFKQLVEIGLYSDIYFEMSQNGKGKLVVFPFPI